jgi:hypothetical protein
LSITAFITQIKSVPFEFIIYSIIFSCINPIFEEVFWRGRLIFLPSNNFFRILYSASLFSFSHFFLWGYWFKSPMILFPTLISTFIMGLLGCGLCTNKKIYGTRLCDTFWLIFLTFPLGWA